VVDRCYWTFAAPLPGGYAQDQSVWWNAVAPVRKPLLRLVGIRVRQPTTAQDHAADFNGILAQGRAMIAGQDTGFVFIHLPVPHPAGFYNRRSGAMGVPGSYIDNLAVADRTLGQLLQDIDSTKLAGQTILIVSSDHSWRIPMWRPEFDWTKEDESASRGAHFDSRPVIIVHFPAQQNGVQIGRPFPLVDMHTMLQQMIAARIEDPQQLTTWAAQR
jgi:membrane-anchored protein YejM (alkaline phosphatase superfamily)